MLKKEISHSTKQNITNTGILMVGGCMSCEEKVKVYILKKNSENSKLLQAFKGVRLFEFFLDYKFLTLKQIQ